MARKTLKAMSEKRAKCKHTSLSVIRMSVLPVIWRCNLCGKEGEDRIFDTNEQDEV